MVGAIQTGIVKMASNSASPLFPLGQIVVTSGVNFRMKDNADFKDVCMKSILRHSTGDFGVISENDTEANMMELQEGCLKHGGGRVLSRYHTDGHPDDDDTFYEGDIFIQTYNEQGTVYTVIMLTDEY